MSDDAHDLRRRMLLQAGVDACREEVVEPDPADAPVTTSRRVVPQSVISRQLANPSCRRTSPSSSRAAGGPGGSRAGGAPRPLFRSFEYASNGVSRMPLPEPSRSASRPAAS